MPAVGTATTPDLSEITPILMVVSVTPVSVAPRAGSARLQDGRRVPTVTPRLSFGPVVGDGAAAPATSRGGPLSRDPQAEATKTAAKSSVAARTCTALPPPGLVTHSIITPQPCAAPEATVGVARDEGPCL